MSDEEDRGSVDVATAPADAVIVYAWPGKNWVTLTYETREVEQRRMIRRINEAR